MLYKLKYQRVEYLSVDTNYLHFSFAILMFFDGKDPRFCLSLYHIFSVFLTSALHSGCDG